MVEISAALHPANLTERRKTDEMKRKRRHLTPEFKACIAIEAFQGIKTINEIAQANELAKVDEAWCPDITYIPMALIVIMDY
jgi:hypothetical protein